MINTVIVEDNLVIQKYLENMLTEDGHFQIVAKYRDAFEAENIVRLGEIDLVLMDVQTLHNHSGISIGERLRKSGCRAKIVVVTSLIDPDIMVRAKSGAADSLWYKDHGSEELLDVINRTLSGERVFPDSSPSVELKDMFSGDISPRQIAFLRRFVLGMTYEEIAKDMNLSKIGVRKILETLIEKGGFENKFELLIAVVENKLIVTSLLDKENE